MMTSAGCGALGRGERSGSGSAQAAASSGMTARPTSVGSMPARSAMSPTIGTLRPPVPQANPIISEDTVAALTGASDCPNVTLTGSVDCRNSPPMREDDDKRRARQKRRGDQERDRTRRATAR